MYYYRLEALDRSGSRNLFGPVSARIGLVPLRTTLGLASPNPARGETAIPFTMGKTAKAKVRIIDLSGREVKLLVDGTIGEGFHSVPWDGRDDLGREMPPGIYLYQLQALGFEDSGRIVRLH
jgi:flagellar hook capping protein FlgD